jgi:hypothetical protein
VIINFEAIKLTIDLDYASDTTLLTEIWVVIIGPLFSLILFMMFAGFAWSFTLCHLSFPSIIFRMIKCFGLVVAFDWVLVLIESLSFGFLTDDW